MSTIGAPVRQARYIELDSLRGLAALIVVLHHLQRLWEGDAEPTSAICRYFLHLVAPFGTEAVMLFFVLSGFVLSLPAVNGRPQTYFTFLIRRIFRIYMPYLAALAVSVAGAFWLHGAITRSDWFHQSWSEPVNWRLVGQHVLFVGTYDSSQFDNPVWSLIHEMRISLVFPLLCGFVLRLKSKWSFVVAAGLTISAIMIEKLPFHIDPSVADSVQYAGLFVLGIFLARERGRLGAWFRRPRRLAKALIGGAFLWLFLFAGQPIAADAPGTFLHDSRVYISQWITAFGAGGLMIVSMNSASCKRVLSWRPIHFLGEVSYSLYLWHFVVILYCVHLLYGKTPLWVILCLALVLSIAVSWCSYRWIEVPSMNLGRKLSNLSQRSPAHVAP
jgi:peptidoglycan/LPS O-acetylase OafA/YrhL